MWDSEAESERIFGLESEGLNISGKNLSDM